MQLSRQFDPMSPEFRANPYPYYDFLREHMPVFYLSDWNIWFCTRYEDCVELLRDSRLGHEILRYSDPEDLGWDTAVQLPEKRARLQEIQSRWMLFRDPPGHTRLRGLVHKAFTPRMVEQLRGRIERITNTLVDRAEQSGQMDLIEDLAIPLPVIVIAELLGVPVEDQEMFRKWSRDMAGTLELVGGDFEAVHNRAAEAAADFDLYFRELAEKRRKDPKDDLLTALVEAEEAGDKLSSNELIATLILLLIAGHETTVNLIGNGSYALLRHPDQFQLLSKQPELVKSAVEEMLRYDSPVQMTTRWVLQPFEFAGQEFKVGQQVGIMFAAANHDPERFENPTRFDITRENNKHLSFGHGIHFCLGAPLARLEGQIAFEVMAKRLPNMQMAVEQPEHRKTYLLRGLASLPVRF